MLKFYCDYCETYLTHDSPSVRKTHCSGRKHKESVRLLSKNQIILEEQAQSLIDKTNTSFQQGRIPPNLFSAPPLGGPMIPPSHPSMMPRPPPMMPVGQPPGMRMPMGDHIPGPPMRLLPHPMMVSTRPAMHRTDR
ncbi:U1 small nuclear ribonucleoprotein C-like [Petaurus breviceps papuanus]|uniref:U1 small nuclear ribonucleoprotein C-like n=1 Tax=Petaurus breviceps papuanus TaxID=3040969 RepID=UPI0036DE33BD